MEKLKMQTPNKTKENIDQIAQLFPNVITETKDAEGKLSKAVDFDLLRQQLSASLVEADNERYRLDWPGKKASLLKANTPINKTLRPCRQDSLNFDTTENLYLEGDNFEVLKILQESYLNKVKMIYIDPPYNTGKDFVYTDKFKIDKDEYEEEIGMYDEEGGRLFKNTDTNGRFHSDWLSMMYERLLVARDLLKDDGVIFISIDDNEVHNLRKICDEVFGEENFIANIVWHKKTQPSFLSKEIASIKEYILMYKKTSLTISTKGGLTDINKHIEMINISNKSSVRILKKQNILIDNGKYSGTLRKGLYGNNLLKIELINEIIVNCGIASSDLELIGKFKWTQETMDKSFDDGDIYHIKNIKTLRPTVEKADKSQNVKPLIDIFSKKLNSVIPTNTDATNEMKKMYNGISPMDYPKPINLISYLIESVCYNDKSPLILDFFSGSATTAHAVMQLNAEDGGKRKFIMVQLAEETDEKSEAFKSGYPTIAEIGKERIRRAGKQIKEELEASQAKVENNLFAEDKVNELEAKLDKLDIGFRVYKTDTSNMKDVYYHPDQYDQMSIEKLISNVKEDRNPEDLLTQVILDWGMELNLPIEVKTIGKNRVYFVYNNSLVACFDDVLDFSIIDEIAKVKPLKVVFKDGSFEEDKDRINLENRFKRLSPETAIRVL